MAKFGKWLGGGLGWAFGGPLGGLLGFALGSLFDTASVTVVTSDGKSFGGGSGNMTQSGDFTVSLLVLAAAVIKADGKVLKSEIEYIKTFFVQQFGTEKTKELMLVLKDILDKPIPVNEVCEQIRHNMDYSMRLQLLHFLFGISMSDSHVDEQELRQIEIIANLLGLTSQDFISIKAMFYRDGESDYKILEIEKTVSDDEVKKAYRKMAVKYHPDKVAQLGVDIQKSAEEKFKKVQEAYENVKKSRGMS